MPACSGIPYFGICLGMQIAVMSYARNVLGYADANSGEFDPNTSHPVIDLMDEPARHLQEGRHHASGRLPLQDPSGQHHGLRLRL